MPLSPLSELSECLNQILRQMDSCQLAFRAAVADVHPRHSQCARNLVDYLAFRADDRSELQEMLASLGLSSLGRSEAAIRAQVSRVLSLVNNLQIYESELDNLLKSDPQKAGRKSLESNADRLFGPPPENRHTRIMVTMPFEAAGDPEMIQGFLKSGMNVARINCAHDSPVIWRRIAERIREASIDSGVPCQIMMDLAGPKLRSGPMAPGPRVAKARPLRDARGRVTHASRILFYPHSQPVPAVTGAISVPLLCDELSQLPGVRRVELQDARQKQRELKVVEHRTDGILISCEKTVYFETGIKVRLLTGDGMVEAEIGSLQPRESYLPLQVGSRLKLVSDERMASPAIMTEDGFPVAPATLSCGVPEALASPEVGHHIKLDDGRFTAQVIEKSPDALLLEIIEAPLGGGKLKAEKGINFPDTDLPVSGLTIKDREDLETVCELADLVALSFVSSDDDVMMLQQELVQRHREDMGIVLKIETRKAYRNLPSLLLTALKSERVGVMIARGDLAVEAGWRQMAELQEEILWLCAAAHIPTIWATQVLESYAKQGQPTRSEITDAAMAQRAECVMLNKGPYMHKTVRLLNRLLAAMDAHQYKKSARLPALPYVHQMIEGVDAQAASSLAERTVEV